MQIRQIAAIALILAGAVACTSSGSDGRTSAPTSTLPTSSALPTTATPTVSASPTPTVATTGPNVRPGEKPPMYPAVSRTNTRSGALSFAQFWVLSWDWAYATMDTSLLTANSTTTCSDCALVTKGFEEARAAKQHFSGGRFILMSSTFASNDGRDGAQQAVDVSFGQRTLRIVSNATNTVVRVDPAVTTATFRFWLKFTGNRWVAVQKGRVTP